MMEEALNRYREKFGENYPMMIVGMQTDEEIIRRINHCIDTNTPEEEPKYEEGADY